MAIYSNGQIKTDCKAIEKDGEVIFPSFEECKSYIENYRNNYYKNWETHTRTIYLNTNTILFLEAFFNSNASYEGVNIHFSVYGEKVSHSQLDENQFLLYFTPTKGLLSTPSDYTALKIFHNSVSGTFPLSEINTATYCPNECDDYTKDWGKSINYSRVPLNLGGGYEGLLLFDPVRLKEYKREYKKKTQFLFFKNNKHTLSFYFKKEKIGRLADFIKKDTKNEFPAIGIYFMSYNKDVDGIGQKREKQITLGMVPMRKMGTTLAPDFCAYNEFIRKYHIPNIILENTVNGKIEIKSIENHSELCPDKCPPDNN